MVFWKSDPLYGLIFAEVTHLWTGLDRESRPEALRIEEHGSADWDHPAIMGPLTNVWMIDDFGIRMVPGLRRESHQTGEVRGAYHRFGLVRFHVAEDRPLVALAYQLGPEIGGELVFEVQGEGEDLRLLVDSNWANTRS